ncbi:hypothetical protein Sps_04735 [Shewanella psychrophila]|uniref:Queuosine precursor transporter n=1 Tax=Shewanella psychrophila TaxID=225848 RepID=A0A1S6HWM7_9GAMM|nr:VUT family protein [Shewanella psychrophila]AQS39818.1 hypothetical protein Sps_04735 [Shewanella psychrophila]
MMFNLYKINKETVEYTDCKGNEFTSILSSLVETQMIEYFGNEDKIKICEKYREVYRSELVIETGLWGSVSVYKLSNTSYLSLLRCMFFMCMILSVLLAPREVDLLNLKQPGGILLFCLSFLFIDTICQSYGYESARKTLVINAFLMFFSGFMIYISSLLPALSDDVSYQDVVFSGMVTLCFINGFASLVADQINAIVFRRVKFITKNKGLWFRSILSTTVSQFFFTILWISFFKYSSLLDFKTYIFILSNFKIKIIFAIIMLPALYVITRYLSKRLKY